MPYIGNIVQDFSVNTAMLNTDSVTSIKIDDGTIVNADINDSAAIAGTKIDPSFKSTGDNIDEISLTHSGNTVKIASLGQISSHGSLALRKNNGSLTVRLSATTESSYINSGGNVGIGTSSPSTPLHVSTNTDGTSDLLTLHADADGTNNGIASIKFTGNTGNHAAFIKGGHTTNGDSILTFHTDAHDSGINPEERMRIDTSGNVGIGTTSIDSALHVYKQTNDRTARFQRISSQHIDITQTSGINSFTSTGKNFEIGTTDSQSFIFDTNGSERMRIDSDGRVIIGATSVSPANSYSNNLVVSEASGDAGISIHGNNSNSNYASIYLSDAGAASRAYLEAQLGSGTSTNFTIGAQGITRFLNNGAERMRIDSSGNVGIGLTSPTSTLHVNGDVRTANRLGVGTAANFANMVSYVSGTGSYPPSGGLVQTNNDDSTAMFWNASNSANYTGLSIECRTTGAAYWMIANVYNSSFSGDLAFRTRTGGSSNAERVRFLRGGGMTFNGDTAAANALYDYEEGDWTPALQHGSPSYNTQKGKYTKIGELVLCSFYIDYSNGSHSSQRLTGLPFAPDTTREEINNVSRLGSAFNEGESSGNRVMHSISHTSAGSTFCYVDLLINAAARGVRGTLMYRAA